MGDSRKFFDEWKERRENSYNNESYPCRILDSEQNLPVT